MNRARVGIVVVALCSGLGVVACGGDEEPRQVDPEALLDTAFSHPVNSAVTRIELAAGADAVPALSVPVMISLDGPYVSGGGVRLPSADWDLEAEVAGFGIEGELVSTGDNVYLSVFGDNYQLGRAAIVARREALSEPGLDPRSWFGPAAYEGDEEVEGTATARIDAPLRGAQLAADLEEFGGRLGLPPVRPPSERGTIQAWIGIDDGIVRELRIDAGEDLAADVVLSNVGEPREITIPAGGGFKPIGDLLSSLQELGVSP
ncbi:MAG: hypothetical protein ACRDK5_04240 [Solirubrobacterales bacterium]